MNPFQYLYDDATGETFVERARRVVEYLRTAADPNEEGESGRSLLTLAITMQLLSGCDDVAAELLDRGADPNQPSPMNIVIALVRSTKVERPPLPLLEKLIAKGMELNNVYDIDDPYLPCKGPSTILDFLDASLGKLSPRRKTLNALANEYVGGLGSIRSFLAEAIALVESHGAKRAAEIMGASR